MEASKEKLHMKKQRTTEPQLLERIFMEVRSDVSNELLFLNFNMISNVIFNIFHLIIQVGDSCRGDSGAPLWIWTTHSSSVKKGRDSTSENMNRSQKDDTSGPKTAVLVGIVSRGKGCGLKNRPGIYVKVHAFLDWIKKEAKLGNCQK